MKSFIISILLFCVSPVNHDIQVAFFKIHQEGKELKLELIFEKEDAIQQLRISEKDLFSAVIESYVLDHFSIEINGQKSKYAFCNIEFKEDHIIMHGKAFLTTKKIQNVAIKNSCLNSVDGHSNIIELRLNNQERDFLMNIDRTQIDVSF